MCRIRRHHSTIALGVLITCGLFLMPSTALANPSIDPGDQMHQGFLLALITLALLIEIAITALILIYACQIDHRLTLVASLTLLNVASFSVFILYLHPKIGSVTITELLIWFAETYAVTHISRSLGERPLSYRQALAVTFMGNMFSYVVGLAA
jgi:hypothetical protein